MLSCIDINCELFRLLLQVTADQTTYSLSLLNLIKGSVTFKQITLVSVEECEENIYDKLFLIYVCLSKRHAVLYISIFIRQQLRN